MDFIKTLSAEFSLKPSHVENVIKLIDDGNTIPFIARYRKELTGSMDDQVLRELSERLTYLRHLQKRKEEVRAAIEALDKWSDELACMLESAETLSAIEDIYRPYKPKRKTRASVARARGLEPLASLLLLHQRDNADPLALALPYVNPEQEVPSPEDALQGAMDIIAENISDDASLRGVLRARFNQRGAVVSKACDAEKESVYTLYYDYSDPVSKIPGYRVLAIDRGEREGFLKVSVVLSENIAEDAVIAQYVRGESACAERVRAACLDAWNRLLYPSLEREIRADLTDAAATAAIRVFGANLRQLLLQPPVKGKVVLGLDPGYRTGCKLALVDATGKVLEKGVIYPTPPRSETEQSSKHVLSLIDKHGVEVIAVGNGTASKETEIFVSEIVKQRPGMLAYMMVSEAGASVYSASKLAAEEFPEDDVSLRSAVSIARRLQDPLAELCKIDPKAIGVGQYQHDMPQKQLSEALDGVVESCVNAVGVDVNTASAPLLTRVAGINASLAKSIVQYREQNGAFSSRKQFAKVPKLGPRAFEQCAGFLRVNESDDLLDKTAVHPESYGAARALLQRCGFDGMKQLDIPALKSALERVDAPSLAESLSIGLPTLSDIIAELQKPGRDPRDELPAPMLRTDIMDVSDLTPGMELTGTVRNVIDFGAFVDIGVHQDGLVHISQLSDKYVRHPSEVVKVGDIVTVYVLSVDAAKKRISLTMVPGKAPGGA